MLSHCRPVFRLRYELVLLPGHYRDRPIHILQEEEATGLEGMCLFDFLAGRESKSLEAAPGVVAIGPASGGSLRDPTSHRFGLPCAKCPVSRFDYPNEPDLMKVPNNRLAPVRFDRRWGGAYNARLA